LKHKGLSTGGKRWLVQALDPFHDSPISATGFPDVDNSNTICTVINSQLQIAAPASAGTGNWDCHVFSLPELYTNQLIVYNQLNNGTGYNITGSAPTSALFGTVNVHSVASGTTFFSSTTGTWGGTLPGAVTADSIGGNYNWVQGDSRLVGIGIEVINTTAEISLQGMATCYRAPQELQQEVEIYANSGFAAFYYPQLYNVGRMPPTTVAGAEVYPNSLQWPAAQGAYLVPAMIGTDNPLLSTTTIPRKYKTISTSGAEYGWHSCNMPGTQVTSLSAVCTNFGAWGNVPGGFWKPVPWGTSGVFFTGLSNSTTLNVNIKYFIEKSPTSDDAMAFLAKRSPLYDPVALQLYARAMANLPPGVPYGENPLGEWFAKVLDAIGTWAPTIGNAIAPLIPEAQLAGRVASIAAKAAAGAMRKSEERTRKAITAIENKTRKFKINNQPRMLKSATK